MAGPQPPPRTLKLQFPAALSPSLSLALGPCPLRASHAGIAGHSGKGQAQAGRRSRWEVEKRGLSGNEHIHPERRAGIRWGRAEGGEAGRWRPSGSGRGRVERGVKVRRGRGDWARLSRDPGSSRRDRPGRSWAAESGARGARRPCVRAAWLPRLSPFAASEPGSLTPAADGTVVPQVGFERLSRSRVLKHFGVSVFHL